MCNKRRIKITATQQLTEAWQRQVTRSVQLSGAVTGEAKVRQALDATLGGPALQALEMALADDASGWVQTTRGFRCDVEGGYVLYLPDERALEIVAVMADSVQVKGEAQKVLAGQVEETVAVEGEGVYYDDGWGGYNEEYAKKQALLDAQRKLGEAGRLRVARVQEEAELSAAGQVEAEARARAEESLNQESELLRVQLVERARQHLDSVGLRCRQVFHRVLAVAYRDTIMAYARHHGAEGVVCQETGDTVDIQFSLRN